MELTLPQSLKKVVLPKDEYVRISRRFCRVSNSLYCEKGYQLCTEKYVAWIGAKTRKKSGKHINFYAFEKRDFSDLNALLNKIYQREEVLKAKTGGGISEIEDLRRNIIFDMTRENNELKSNFAQINRDLKQRIATARLKIGDYFQSETFSIDKCHDLWYDEYCLIVKEEKFKDMNEFLLKNYLTFNIAFQFVYDCATNTLPFKEEEFLNLVNNVNALTFGLKYSSYRNVRAFIRGANWTAVEEEEISKKMQILVDWYLNDKECKKLHPLESAAILNCEIVRTQPYSDGNHRTARLITNEVLIKQDVPPIAINLGKRDEYNKAVNKAIETHEIDDVIEILYREVYRNALKIDAKLDLLEKNNALTNEK